MINGRLYDSETMHEIGNYNKEHTPSYFEQEGSGNAYPFYQGTNSFMPTMCGCRHQDNLSAQSGIGYLVGIRYLIA